MALSRLISTKNQLIKGLVINHLFTDTALNKQHVKGSKYSYFTQNKTKIKYNFVTKVPIYVLTNLPTITICFLFIKTEKI